MLIFKSSISLPSDIYLEKHHTIRDFHSLPVIETHLSDIDENTARIYMEELPKKHKDWGRIDKKTFNWMANASGIDPYLFAVAHDLEDVGHIYKFLIFAPDYVSAEQAMRKCILNIYNSKGKASW